jgi:hypothetical protein
VLTGAAVFVFISCFAVDVLDTVMVVCVAFVCKGCMQGLQLLLQTDGKVNVGCRSCC